MKKIENIFADLRENYEGQSLEITQVAEDPFKQFNDWFEEAQNNKIREPNVMTLATATPDGKPSARIVLLKGVEPDGFVFYSNYTSRKGSELSVNPQAALVFLWLDLARQVRIEGIIEKVSREKSAEYFQSRPKGSQIGAWASPQSKVIKDRSVLEDKALELKEEFTGVEKLPVPEFWGGYKLVPSMIEFWQGRANRLHDRVRYTKQPDESWKIDRLAP